MNGTIHSIKIHIYARVGGFCSPAGCALQWEMAWVFCSDDGLTAITEIPVDTYHDTVLSLKIHAYVDEPDLLHILEEHPKSMKDTGLEEILNVPYDT